MRGGRFIYCCGDLGMIYCCVMSCVIVTCYRSEASGIYMECVVVVVMVDNG